MISALATVLFLSAPQVTPLEATAGISVTEVSIPAALSELQRRSGTRITFSASHLPANRQVSCSCETVSVAQALQILLADTDVSITTRGSVIALVPSSPAPTSPVTPAPSPQTVGEIVGTVVSGNGDTPLPGALLTLQPGGQTVWSSSNGSFRFREVPGGTYRIRAEALGHASRDVEGIEASGAETVVRITLQPEAIRLSEVVVTPGAFSAGNSQTVSATRVLSRDQVLSRPQFGEDALRAIRRLPGVTSHDVGVRLNVRGAATEETLITVDGFELQEGYHLQEFEGGILSVIDIHTLGGIQLFSGGFGVEQGGYSAALLALTTRTDSPNGGPNTQVGLSFNAATFLNRGAFSQGQGSWILSVRRGFLDLILSDPDDPKVKYIDALARINYQFSPRHRMSIHGLIARDDLTATDTDPVFDIESQWQVGAFWTNWTSLFGQARWTVQPSVAFLNKDRNARGFDPVSEIPGDRIDVRDKLDQTAWRLRSELGVDISPRLSWRLGGDIRAAGADYDAFFTVFHPAGPQSNQFGNSPSGTSSVGWTSLRYRPTPSLVVEAGARAEHYGHTDETTLTPRLLAAWTLTDQTTLRAGVGEYSQVHQLHDLHPADGQSEFEPYAEATTASAGLEHRFGSGLSLRVEGYHRSTDNPQPLFTNLRREFHVFPALVDDRRRLDPTESRARGVEVILKRAPGNRFDWGINYIWSVSENLIDGVWRPADWDQPHALAFDGSFRITDNWALSGAGRFRSGWPVTPGSADVSLPTDQEHPAQLAMDDFNSARLSSYQRIDVRITRRWTDLEIYLDLLNLLDHENVRALFYTQRYSGGQWRVDSEVGSTNMGFAPSIGFRWSF